MQWLQDVFIPYLDKWESSVKARPETSFSKSDKERMLLSAETRLHGTENDRYSYM